MNVSIFFLSSFCSDSFQPGLRTCNRLPHIEEGYHGAGHPAVGIHVCVKSVGCQYNQPSFHKKSKCSGAGRMAVQECGKQKCLLIRKPWQAS